ncbi:MAG: DUF3244 domain-containing protein [Muribaculaceae bacterium]|nr:DUF3244 domain-containing protein [Muribaculaceae bacterium]
MKPIVFLIIAMACSCITTSAKKEKVPLYKTHTTFPNNNKHHAPTKINVEAWIDESILTITFLQPEGGATITFDSECVYNQEELTFSTDAPFTIDITPYGAVSSFTIETEAGHTYIGIID